jgi:hypothetical protein
MVAAVVFAGAAAVQAKAPSSATEFRPATPEEAQVRSIAPGERSAPSALAYEARCDETTPRASIVSLRWTVAAEEGVLGQRVDISKFPEGFDTGRFETTDLLAPQLATAIVAAPEPGILYYWRVWAATPDGFIASRVERFDAPTCPADSPNLDPDDFSPTGSASAGARSDQANTDNPAGSR